jgi:hypothetical protein
LRGVPINRAAGDFFTNPRGGTLARKTPEPDNGKIGRRRTIPSGSEFKGGGTVSKKLLSVLTFIAPFALGLGPAFTQEPPPTPAELTLHPGDTITWSFQTPHRLRFGGTVTHSGANLALTPFADVQKVLEDFEPPPPAESGGVVRWPTGPDGKVAAKVRADTSTPPVTEFFFTCGFDPHTGLMVTVPFKIEPGTGQPARHLQIISANPPRWVLKGAPDKKLSRP